MKKILVIVLSVFFLSASAEIFGVQNLLRRTKLITTYPEQIKFSNLHSGIDFYLELIEQNSPILQEKGSIFLGFSGETGAGQSTFANLLAQNLRSKGYKLVIIGCDKFLIPKEQRLDPDAGKVIILKLGGEVEVPELKIKIKRISEEQYQVISLIFTKEVILSELGNQIRVSGEDIFLTRLADDKLHIMVEETIGKFDIYGLVKVLQELHQGKSVFIPQFDQVSRKTWFVSDEELKSLQDKKTQTEEIESRTYIQSKELSSSLDVDIWVDAETGQVFERIDPQGKVIIVEGIFTLHRDEINNLFLMPGFIMASHTISTIRAVRRHILEDRYRGDMVDKVIKHHQGFWQPQHGYAEKQEAKAGVVIINEEDFDRGQMFLHYGSEEERINKAVSVYRYDITANRISFNPYQALEYIFYTFSRKEPLYNVIKQIIEKKLEGRALLSDFKDLNPYEKSILYYLLEKVGLLKREDLDLRIQTSWASEHEEIFQHFASIMSNHIEKGRIPLSVLNLAIENNILDDWGFKSFIEGLREKGFPEHIIARDYLSSAFIYFSNVLYAWQKAVEFITNKAPEKILVLGAGNLEWVIPTNFYFAPDSITAVEKDELRFQEAKENRDLWKLTAREIELKVGDILELSAVLDKPQRYDLIILRTPFDRLKDIVDSLREAKDYLSEGGDFIIYIRSDELSVPSIQRFLSIVNELGILTLSICPLSETGPLLSYELEDCFVILNKERLNALISRMLPDSH